MKLWQEIGINMKPQPILMGGTKIFYYLSSDTYGLRLYLTLSYFICISSKVQFEGLYREYLSLLKHLVQILLDS
jgi:hypothetical protein